MVSCYGAAVMDRGRQLRIQMAEGRPPTKVWDVEKFPMVNRFLVHQVAGNPATRGQYRGPTDPCAGRPRFRPILIARALELPPTYTELPTIQNGNAETGRSGGCVTCPAGFSYQYRKPSSGRDIRQNKAVIACRMDTGGARASSRQGLIPPVGLDESHPALEEPADSIIRE